MLWRLEYIIEWCCDLFTAQVYILLSQKQDLDMHIIIDSYPSVCFITMLLLISGSEEKDDRCSQRTDVVGKTFA